MQPQGEGAAYRPPVPPRGQPGQPPGQPPAGGGAPPAQGQPAAPQPEKPRRGKGLKTLIALALLLVIVGIVLHSTLFKIRYINVYGNVNLSQEEIVIQSGLAKDQNIFSVDKHQVEERINSNRYLKYQNLRRDYPDTITLVVYERVPCATFQTLGIQYTVDKTGMVLEQTEELTPVPGMIVMTGIKVEQAGVGRQLILKSEKQLKAMQEILYEIEMKGLDERISELNLSDLENLYLVTVDGFSVRLGPYEMIGPKLISLDAVHQELLRRELSGGTIDVSAPIYPTYIP